MGKVTTYIYNSLGKVESVTDSLSHRTEFTYNSRGENTEVRDTANNIRSATYDLLGNIITHGLLMSYSIKYFLSSYL